MERLRAVWAALNRERTLRRARRRSGRRSRSGVALLLVITTVAMMTVLVTEIVHGAAIRLQLATNQRDEAQAEALAMGGVQFYRLLLIASKQLEGSGIIAMAAQFGIPLSADTLWQIVPVVDSRVMRMILLAGGDEDEAKEMNQRGLTEEEEAASREFETSLDKPFLDFEGNFSASVSDEDRRIFVARLTGQNMAELMGDPHAGLLASLMAGPEQDKFLNDHDLERWELIANLADWTDRDDRRLFDGGLEDAAYEDVEEGDEPYRPKNAPFDTLEEIRLVDQWQRDSVWFRYGRHLTIYGSGQINVNTAERRVLESIFQRYITPPPTPDSMDFLYRQIQAFRTMPITNEGGGGIWRDTGNFIAFLREMAPGSVDEGLAKVLTTKSTVFRVKSKGEVRDAKVSIEAVFDFSTSPVGKILYWHVQ